MATWHGRRWTRRTTQQVLTVLGFVVLVVMLGLLDADTGPLRTWRWPVLGVVAAVTVGIAAAAWRHHRKRMGPLRRLAERHDLALSPGDPYNLRRLPFPAFDRAAFQSVARTLHGAIDGTPVRVFDLRYGNPLTARYDELTVAALETPMCRWPDLRIVSESLHRELGLATPGRGLDFESADFNRRYHVSAADRETAYRLLDARMMGFLLSTGACWDLVANGRWIAVMTHSLPPSRFLDAHEVLVGVRDRIPRGAWERVSTSP